MLTTLVYATNSIFIFFMDLNVIDYVPASFHESNTPQKRADETHPLNHYGKIWERNLFSLKTDEQHEVSEMDLLAQIDRLSLTSLNCTLIGTIINESGDSWAIIKDNQSNRQDRYTVGSTISGAKVKIIIRNKVVLNIDGRDELLVMGIEKIRAEKAGAEKSGKEAGEGDIVTYKISKNFIQESINNVAQIMSNVRIKPYFKDGKPEGFKINRIKQGSILKTMGFKDDDIIRSVNGKNIRSAEDIMKLYTALKDSKLFSIGIVRNKQTKILNFKVR